MTTENSTSTLLYLPQSNLSHKEQIMWHILFYGLAVVCGLLNLFVVLVIPSDSTLRSRITNWFLWTISLGYLCCSIFVTPFSFKSKIYGPFDPAWAPWICQTRPAIQMATFNLEILLLLSLAVRYFIDFKNLQKDLRLTFWGGFFIIFIVLTVSVGISVPWGLFRDTVPLRNSDGEIQYEVCKTTENRYWKLYNDLIVFAGGAVTVVVTDVMFMIVAVKAWKTVQAFQAAKTELKLLIVLLVAFNILWLPTIVIFSIGSIDKLTGNHTIPRSLGLTLSLANGLWHDSVGLCNPILFLISTVRSMRKSRRVSDLHRKRFRNRAMAIVESDFGLEEESNYPVCSMMLQEFHSDLTNPTLTRQLAFPDLGPEIEPQQIGYCSAIRELWPPSMTDFAKFGFMLFFAIGLAVMFYFRKQGDQIMEKLPVNKVT